MKKLSAILFVIGLGLTFNANAWFFFFLPMPTGWPSALSTQVKTLADSNQTKALAYVGEDKTFGAKYYVWGQYLGDIPQKEAIKIALDRCNAALARAKAEMNGSSPKWDFGDKKCELYGFPQMPETAVMPSPEEMMAEPKPTNEPKQSDSFPTRLSPVTSQVAPIVTPPVESKPQVVPLVQPLSATEGGKRLIELKSLLDQGVITQQDYDTKKAQILKSM
jgi:hypothetical protein